MVIFKVFLLNFSVRWVLAIISREELGKRCQTPVHNHSHSPKNIFLQPGRKIFFSSTRVWTQGLALGRQHSTTWAMPLVLFWGIGYFWGRVSHYVQADLVCDPICASPCTWSDRCLQPASHWLRWGLTNCLCLGWPWTMSFPISTSQVSRMTGLSHPSCWRKNFCPSLFTFTKFLSSTALRGNWMFTFASQIN
jgi:hypothetical protein